MLIILGGLPGTGKTTLARELARRLGAMHLRVDSIEQALRNTGRKDVGAEGYGVAQQLATDNLTLGLTVIADSVNPVAASRAGWRAAATAAGAAFVEVELTCADAAEHRHRVDGRQADIPGHVVPRWPDVLARDYEPWAPDLVIDTAGRSSDAIAAELITLLEQRRRPA